MSYTIDDVVRVYVQRRDEIKAIGERHAAELKPHLEKQHMLEQALLSMLNAGNLDSAKTEHGTAYRSTQTSVTVDKENDGWSALVDFIVRRGIDRVAEVMERDGPPEDAVAAFRDMPELSLFNQSVNKTVVKEMMDAGQAIPGVKIAQIMQVGVRRA
jgi:hypothetical protein